MKLTITASALTMLAFTAPIAVRAADGPMGVERVARETRDNYEVSGDGTDDAIRWVQIDLGKLLPIDQVKMFPVIEWTPISQGFPSRFKIEISDDADFHNARVVTDQTGADFPRPADEVAIFSGGGQSARYVRLTATHLREGRLSLSKFEV
ncbi:discoidin domain-containing protein, partial [bacterium]